MPWRLNGVEQRGDVLADIMVGGAGAKIRGALVVMVQRARGDFTQRRGALRGSAGQIAAHYLRVLPLALPLLKPSDMPISTPETSAA